MANKNTIKVRARRLRQAHERKINMLQTIDKRNGIIPSRFDMVTIIGTTSLVKSSPWDIPYRLNFRSQSIYRIQGITTCLCDHHLLFPLDSEYTFNHIFNPAKCISSEVGDSFIEDFYNPKLCIESFLEFLNDLNDLD